jgi:MscS family membrane protein
MLEELLPPTLVETRFLEVQLWQWLGLLLAVLAAWLLSWIAIRLVQRAARPVVARTSTRLDDELLDLAAGPVRLALALGIFFVSGFALRLSAPAYRVLAGAMVALVVVAVTWLALRAADVVAALAAERLERIGRRDAVAVVPLGRRVVKAVLLVLAALAVLQNLGVNVNGLVAGLGVGGIAVALAAQKTIANLFGGVSLVTDQPIRVGDFCRFGDNKIGTVEEIGLRSTRVRTLDRTLVTIPNAEFSEIQLENFGARDRMRLHAMIGLRYETTPDQLRHVLAALRRLLIEHPRVTESPARVRFVGFGAHSLDLEVFAYVDTADWNEFLKVREDIYLRMMDAIRDSGTGFAFPSQTLYLGRDSGLDAGRREAAERQVGEWRRCGELPFPDFAAERVAEWDGTADYPPRGSAAGGSATLHTP